MGIVDRRLALLSAVAAQRRARLRHPHDADLAAVEELLRDELGSGVSQRVAARFLGFTPQALARWVASGDVPLVIAPSGQREVPVNALLRLKEDVDAARAAGSRHALEATVREGRSRADHITLSSSPVASDRHGRAQRRALEYHRALARHLGRREILDARATLQRWRRSGRIAPEYADAWQALLDGPRTALRDAMVSEDQWGDDLRQNSPFAGLLSEAERRRVLDLVA